MNTWVEVQNQTPAS